MHKLRPVLLMQSALVGVMLVAAACGGSSGKDIKGQVTKVDTKAKTFSVKATDGKDYDFKLVSGSKADINEIKTTHLDGKAQVEVKYKGSSSPYDVDSAD